MHGRRSKKTPCLLLLRAAAVIVLAVVFTFSSFSAVMANTVSAIVIDGDKTYTFSMESADLDVILSQAEELGLEPLSPLDTVEQVENTTTVNIRRGVPITVTEAGKRTNLVAYLGDTVEKTLEDHTFLLKDEDEVLPGRETMITSGLSVEIRRRCQVTVEADGEEYSLSLTGGTVADALKQAGITLSEKDSVNYGLTEPLFDKMNLRVSRVVKLTITADGETKEYEVSAATVEEAVEKCGVKLSEQDRLDVDGKTQPKDGMHVTVTRVTVEEVEELEEIDYPVQYLTSDEMYEDEVEIRTPGEKGEKKVTYQLTYVEGELESKEAVKEESVKEPVPEVAVKGTKVREAQTLVSDYEDAGAGTFVDSSGQTVTYTKKLVGTCTAYYPLNPGDGTATGVTAGYGCIAVNPNVIPYGTWMYVTSPDGSIVYGYGQAVDTGGAVMAGEIIADLCYDTRAECSIIGRRDMVIYILG